MNMNTSENVLKGTRILVGKPGLDGHDIGAKIIALALRNAGAEVIYTGLRRSPEQIARVAVDEGVNAIGLSILSGSHKELVPDVMERLRAAGLGGVAVFVGGTIPLEDQPYLKEVGVTDIFTADMPLADVVSSIARTLA
ncbi:MAG: cobalamin B12-binding domain-containing protein [Rhodobacteraceae bacterium]|nr:cobalamin B12-binding domain-containing protein [Paracoccaceae bacterium]